ncbi:hypothetical protein OS493_028646 [Desmophyllum pertusum]|uniref:DZIP3-like HEPN domain-containing protein n=1 Tax=Desmophyllum pertusum TaxID=174260 RepID=A0A9X0CJ12_9CNID|nr:hypothetical protein OS493_028646 [Desmophyllum pertusum]
MASLAGEEDFNSTNDDANRQRLARLLICGGARLLREKLDSIHTSDILTIRLLGTDASQPASYFKTKMTLELLNQTCGLTRRFTEWQTLPHCEDYSLEADLARITYHFELECWHKDNDFLTDAEFDYFWREVSETFLRIAASISTEKKNQWQIYIDGFRRDPLILPEETKYVKEIHTWTFAKAVQEKVKIN